MSNRHENIMAEQAIIGAIMADSRSAVPQLVNRVHPEMFCHDLLRQAYTAALRVFADYGNVDFIPLYDILKAEYSSQECRKIIASCVEILGSISMLPHYVSIVVNLYKARELEKLCSEFALGGTSPDDIDGQLEQVGARIAELLQGQSSRGLTRVSDIIVEQYKNLFEKGELDCSVRTGLPKLDSVIKRFRKKQLIVLAARPGIGKSALALNWARSFAGQGKNVAFYSLEMSKEELFERYIANMAPINLGVLQERDFGDDSLGRINSAVSDLGKLPIYINDFGGQTVQRIRMEVQLKKIDVVIIDYLQLLTPTGRNYNRNDEVGKITRELKQMAMDLDIPVIALSQLNRGKTESQEPTLSSLRDSGSIEQDANIVVFLWENEPRGEKPFVDLACRVAKNRNGKTGELVLRYTGGVMKFEETGQKVRRSKRESAQGSMPWREMGNMGIFDDDE